MSIEKSFRIMSSQLEKLVEITNEGAAYAFAKCGTGFVDWPSGQSSKSWCVQEIYQITPENVSKAHGCFFFSDYSELVSCSYASETVLWGILENGYPKVFCSDGASLSEIDECVVVGDDLQFSFFGKGIPVISRASVSISSSSNPLYAFGSGTTAMLSHLTIGVAGVSGTGSIVVEQLVRLGTKRLVLVDDDIIERRNLGRIINSSVTDAKEKTLKVDMMQKVYSQLGLSTEIVAIPKVILNADAIHALSQCDVIFGCLDSVDGRMHLNRISTFYNIPYIDLGVQLQANSGIVDSITGAIRYVIPGKSSLISRGVYTVEQVASQSLRREDPVAFEERLKEKYIQGVQEENPAVIPVNMQIASLGVLELLNRIHPYRSIPNSNIETVYVDLTELAFPEPEPPSACDNSLQRYLGRGDCIPLLNMPYAGGTR